MASRAAFSFTIAGEEKGAFSVCADEPGFFDEKMIGLLKQMAADISFALESMEKENSRRNAESALLQETREKLDALQELRKSDRILVEQSHFAAMGELISNIAHHWRQPLNVLGLMIQELPAAYDSGDLTAEYLEDTASRAMEEINALSRTIDDFGYYFKSGHGKTAIDAKDVMERAITLVAASLRERHLRLQTVVEGSVTVEGVERELFQVLLNILINARDVFLERKVEAPKITVKMFTEDEKAVITIADNAGGIPEEIVGRVFDPYLTTKGPDRGTGVGLYMAKIIVERNMRGSLRARNTDEGAEFRIEV
jgi:signal transduction histidine kinase